MLLFCLVLLSRISYEPASSRRKCKWHVKRICRMRRAPKYRGLSAASAVWRYRKGRSQPILPESRNCCSLYCAGNLKLCEKQSCCSYNREGINCAPEIEHCKGGI